MRKIRGWKLCHFLELPSVCLHLELAFRLAEGKEEGDPITKHSVIGLRGRDP